MGAAAAALIATDVCCSRGALLSATRYALGMDDHAQRATVVRTVRQAAWSTREGKVPGKEAWGMVGCCCDCESVGYVFAYPVAWAGWGSTEYLGLASLSLGRLGWRWIALPYLAL